MPDQQQADNSEGKIEVIRQYHTFNFVNACVMNVEVRLFLRIPKGISYYSYPFERGYLPELKAKLQDGTELPILPYDRIFTLKDIQEYHAKLFSGVSEEMAKEYDNFALIVLPGRDKEYYDELTILWQEKISEEDNARKPDTLTKMTREVKLFRIFPPTAQSSLYVAIKIDEKYELVDDPVAYKIETVSYGINNDREAYNNVKLDKQKDYQPILEDKRNFVIRFNRNFNHPVKIEYVVSVPRMVNNWLWLDFVLGIAVEFVRQ